MNSRICPWVYQMCPWFSNSTMNLLLEDKMCPWIIKCVHGLSKSIMNLRIWASEIKCAHRLPHLLMNFRFGCCFAAFLVDSPRRLLVGPFGCCFCASAAALASRSAFHGWPARFPRSRQGQQEIHQQMWQPMRAFDFRCSNA